ncbi:hypothetical protein PROFUN_05774 [Planoprotostelium fungivorum]|uniref:Stress-associated endoplasmic reticulum protein n=1 Tax=Planoprotostelium fungivorum TaxID=1890364 RepID=A0A2P6NPX6_9EUKA|nr:hypothetical protein PROFUN_05774 [Planoprotostelium fungivorum]
MVIQQRIDKFDENVNKRGSVVTAKKESKTPVGPLVLGILIFVVIGSALLQIFKGQ